MSECLNELKFVLFVLFFMNFIIYLHLSITVYLSSGSYISCHHQMLVGDRSPPSKCDVSSMVTSGELWTQTWGTLRSSTWSHQVHNIYAETRNCHVLFCHNTKDFSQFLFVMHGPLLEVFWNTHLEILLIQFWCYLHPHSWPPVQENTKSKLLLIISFYQWCHVFFFFSDCSALQNFDVKLMTTESSAYKIFRFK